MIGKNMKQWGALMYGKCGLRHVVRSIEGSKKNIARAAVWKAVKHAGLSQYVLMGSTLKYG
jgi:hypothetical protein